MPSAGEVTVTRPAVGFAAIFRPDRAVAIDPDLAVGHGKAGQHRAVGEAEREETAGIAADPGVEILEIFREHRGLDDAGEAAVRGVPAAADAEERCALIGQARRQRAADEHPGVLGDHAP